MQAHPAQSLGWIGIARIGLVQAALGSIVVLATSTINRVMVVELALPAILPGALVALHYLVQLLRPRLGYGSDVGERRTPWILGGMLVLVCGGVGAAGAAALMAHDRLEGIALAVLAFVLIGVGVGACGTSLLVLLAKRVAAEQRPAAATLVWLMMIAGFIVTTVLAGHFLEPFTFSRLLWVTASVGVAALATTLLSVWGLEGPREPVAAARANPDSTHTPFRLALRQVWEEPAARRLALFVFVSMLAYSAEELILDPFAGAVFGMTPGQSTQLSGLLHSGVFGGMLTVGIVASWLARRGSGTLRPWMVASCALSACALLGLVAAGLVGPGWPLKGNVIALGWANGMFTVAAVSSMMTLVGRGRERREGVRMGLWGAAQGIAFGLGGISASGASDLAHALLASPGAAYAVVFGLEAVLFGVAAHLARGLEAASGGQGVGFEARGVRAARAVARLGHDYAAGIERG
jgi:BCD family chlorophyll transporter-like MFS transporter